MSKSFSHGDELHMRRALRLAARGQGLVEPNPMVGAVIVASQAKRSSRKKQEDGGRKDEILGEGYHHRFGEAHAEVMALRQAAKLGHEVRGATMYVTLEPCGHQGKTPPCTQALIEAGIRRVVVAMVDPFAKVRGKGIAMLRRQGIQVEVGLLKAEARRLNAPFMKRVGTAMQAGRPYVIAKWAQSVDGCIATARGESKWISSEASRAQVQQIRGRVDGILVGLGTVLADDPLLMARPERYLDLRRLATRIVLDSHCRLPLTSQLVRTLSFAPVLVVHVAGLNRAALRRRTALANAGVMLLEIPADALGHPQLTTLLRVLAQQEYTNLLVEGGGEVLASFFKARLVDEAHIFMAPKIIGGENARHAVAGCGSDLMRLAEALPGRFEAVTFSGPDLHLVAHFPG